MIESRPESISSIDIEEDARAQAQSPQGTQRKVTLFGWYSCLALPRALRRTLRGQNGSAGASALAEAGNAASDR